MATRSALRSSHRRLFTVIARSFDSMTTAKFCAFIAPSGTLPAAEPCLARPALLRVELHRLGAVRLILSSYRKDAPLLLCRLRLSAH
jgi:hypothetical protein